MRACPRALAFLGTQFALAAAGETDAQGHPGPISAAALFNEYADAIRVEALPVRMIAAALGPLASLLSHRERVRALRAPSRA